MTVVRFSQTRRTLERVVPIYESMSRFDARISVLGVGDRLALAIF